MNPVEQMTARFRKTLGIQEEPRRPKKLMQQLTLFDEEADDHSLSGEVDAEIVAWIECKSYTRMIDAILRSDCCCGPEVIFVASRVMVNNMPGEEALMEAIRGFDGTDRRFTKIINTALGIMTKNGLPLKLAKLKLCDFLRLVHQAPPNPFLKRR